MEAVEVQGIKIQLTTILQTETCPIKPDLLDALPFVLQEEIAKKVAEFGQMHVFNLWCCSRQWMGVCDDLIMTARVPAYELADAMPFLNRLPRLEHITISHKILTTIRIRSNALSLLQARLTSLSLTSECANTQGMASDGDSLQQPERWVTHPDCNSNVLVPRHVRKLPTFDHFLDASFCSDSHNAEPSSDDEKEEEEAEKCVEHMCVLVVEDLGMLIQPWYNSLVHLHLDHCQISGVDVGRPTYPPVSIFSKLLSLQTLHLCSLHASAKNGAPITALKLSGCTSLQHLYYFGNSFADLDVLGCDNLVLIVCKHNQLASLRLQGCLHLKHLHCSYNPKLYYVALNPSAHLQTLSCVGSSIQPVILGGALQTSLRCSADSLRWLFPAGSEVRQHLVRLSIRNSLVAHVENGFRDLEYLRCKFLYGTGFGFGLGFGSGNGLVDLSGCTLVELNCQSDFKRLPVLACEVVQKLTLEQLGSWQPDLCKFTALQELNLTLHMQTSVDLSVCRMLQKVRLATASLETCRMTSINVSQCSQLKQLHCDNFLQVMCLDLTSCSSLTSLTCTKSGLPRLDTSQCPLLTALDVSGSEQLFYICISNCNDQLVIRAEGCEKLLVTQFKRAAEPGHQLAQHWGIAAFNMQTEALAAPATHELETRSQQHNQKRQSSGLGCWSWLHRLCSQGI